MEIVCDSRREVDSAENRVCSPEELEKRGEAETRYLQEKCCVLRMTIAHPTLDEPERKTRMGEIKEPLARLSSCLFYVIHHCDDCLRQQ
ncbi:hypothetical protein J6590_027898 [Homalodisca vitripennis]|nr:hypothetical protein J6590_027898 [Homalodisca vitripennis]